MSRVNVRQSNGVLSFEHINNYESRGVSSERLIREAVSKYGTTKDFAFSIHTGDAPVKAANLYSFSTADKHYSETFPCFIFDAYPECGLADYEAVCESLENTVPSSTKIGWIGATMVDVRSRFMEHFANTEISEGLSNAWNRENRADLASNTPTYMTYQQQVDRWKYLIDMQGCGYSGRLKVMLRSPRIVFLVERPYEEWFFRFLKPWVHYVPVKQDLSDLRENYHRIEGDPMLQKVIGVNQRLFANTYLTRAAALREICRVILISTPYLHTDSQPLNLIEP